MFESTDPHAAPLSVRIDLFVDWFDDPCVLATCTAHVDGLRLRRAGDMHGYVVRRGGTSVYAMGGVGVDLALLRRAALDARPVTDEELLRVLPPAPKKGRFG